MLKILYPGNLVKKVGRIAIPKGKDLVFEKSVPVRFSIATHSGKNFGILTQIFSGRVWGHVIHDFYEPFGVAPDFFALYKAVMILEKMYFLNGDHPKHAYFVACNPHPDPINSGSDFFTRIDADDLKKIMTSRIPISLYKVAFESAKALPIEIMPEAVMRVQTTYIDHVDQMQSS